VESKALEDDLESFVNSGKLVPGIDNVASRPGAYIVLAREYAKIGAKSSTANEGGLGAGWSEYEWQRYFYCENWQSPSGKFQIVHVAPSQDPNGLGVCYIEWGGAPKPPPSPSPSPPPSPPSPGAAGTIQHVPSGRCLAVMDNGIWNGNGLVVAACDGSDQQNWVFDQDDWILKSQDNTDMCVDAPDGGLWKGNYLEVWECNGADGQKFGYDEGMNTIYAGASSDASLCMDVLNGGNEDGDQVWLWDCYGGDNQQFRWNQQLSLYA